MTPYSIIRTSSFYLVALLLFLTCELWIVSFFISSERNFPELGQLLSVCAIFLFLNFLVTYLHAKTSQKLGVNISIDSFDRNLLPDGSLFTSVISELNQKIIIDPNRFAQQFFFPLGVVVSRALYLFFLTIFIFLFLSGKQYLGILILFASLIPLILITKNFLNKLGQKIQDISQLRLSILNDFVNGYYELYSGNAVGTLRIRFVNETNSLGNSLLKLQLFNLLPRVSIETVLVCTALVFMYFGKSSSFDVQSVTQYSLGLGYIIVRVMPQIQQLFLSVSNVQTMMPLYKSYLKGLRLSKQSLEVELLYEKDVLNIKKQHLEIGGRQIIVPHMRIPNGSKIAITGASGIGKSTFLRLVLHALKNKKTSLTVRYCPQFPWLFNEDLSFNVFLDEGQNEKSARNLAEFNFHASKDNFNNKIPALSGGEKMRLGLARAFVSRSDIVLLDEPTSGLDLNNRQSVMNKIFSQETILIMATHDQDLINHCDQCYKLLEKPA